MRPIKFRAWSHENNSFVHIWLGSPSATWVETDFIGTYGTGAPSELQQFTGLLDKNGCEIYEGDILRWYPQKRKNHSDVEVAWDEARAGWYLGEWYENDFPDTSTDSLVIGNIYENPELVREASA